MRHGIHVGSCYDDESETYIVVIGMQDGSYVVQSSKAARNVAEQILLVCNFIDSFQKDEVEVDRRLK